MNFSEVISKIKSSSLNIRLLDETAVAKHDLVLRIPLASYQSFCKECREGKFLADPRLVFIAVSGKADLTIRIDEGFTGDGILASIILSDEEKVPSISDLWPVARWHEREITAKHGIAFDYAKKDEIELAFGLRVEK
jgi:hypothetical protein